MARLTVHLAGAILAFGLTFGPNALAQQNGDPNALNDQVRELIYTRKYGEALPMAKRALTLAEAKHGPSDAEVGFSLHNLALILEAQGLLAEAVPLYERALPIREKDLGTDNIEAGQILNNLAAIYQIQGRYADAEPFYKRAISIFENALGPDHAAVATGLNNLAEVYKELGRYAEAEPLLKRSLATREKALGLDHPDVGKSLNNLAVLYIQLGRAPESEPLYRRAVEIAEHALGPNDAGVAVALNNLAFLYKGLRRYSEAEPLYNRALAIREKAFGPDHADVGQTLNNLAQLYVAQEQYAKAEPLLKRDLEISEKALGPEHPAVATTRNNLASLYQSLGRSAEAEPLYKHALASIEAALGANHPNTSAILDNLAGLYFAEENWAEAAEHWMQSTDILIRRFRRTTEVAGTAASTDAGREVEGLSVRFRNLVRAVYRQAEAEPELRDELSRAMFQSAQWGQSSKAALSLAKMASRTAKGSTFLARLVRERQDLVGAWQAGDKQLIATRSETPEKRNADAEAAMAANLSAIDEHIVEIDATLSRDFPDYAALANPEPVTVEGVQAHLRADEAVVLILDMAELKPAPEETFIWVVTKTQSRWVKSDLGTKALSDRVGALRCGLDEAAWSGDGAKRCLERLKLDAANAWRRGKPLPFDVAIAHELYAGLFGQIEDLIKDKHLLIVPSGPLTSLPFHLLVTKSPVSDTPGQTPIDGTGGVKVSDQKRQTPAPPTPWLIRDHAITVLPSVASLVALRSNAKTSTAPEPFIGFGNPVLTGSARCGKVSIPDKCPEEETQVASAADTEVSRSSGDVEETAAYFRNGLADVDAIRTRLCPLPDTAHELKCVARSLGAADSSVVLAGNMTETALKKAPLDRYRILHFATHGLLAGETVQLAAAHAEPSLVMSPPDTPTEDDDGLLTASEVAGLKLDADWVVMSACNTAGPSESGQAKTGSSGTEALSGLARAFFYAGSRALLVSHWPVNSYAATMLTSRTFAAMKKDTHIGRSEALRRAMLALMSDEKRPWAAQPSVWAPFVVVGEGGNAVAK
jgi:CHAT domain-containing protein/tetratricopeptide (TPR) repeat protein